MRRPRLSCLVLLVPLMLGALATTIASAEEGFLPLISKEDFVAGKKTTFTTTSGTSLSCKEIDLSLSVVNFPNDKHGSGKLHLLGCESSGLGLLSLGDEPKVVLIPVLLLVCLKPTNSKGEVLAEFGLAIEIEKAHLEIPAVGTLFELNGRALGVFLTKGPTKEFTVDFVVKEKQQEAVACKEGKLEKTNTLAVEVNHSGKPEATSLAIEGGKLEFLENVELMDE